MLKTNTVTLNPARVSEEDGSIPVDAELFPKAMPGIAQLGAKDYLALGTLHVIPSKLDLKKQVLMLKEGGVRDRPFPGLCLQDEVLLGHNRVGPDLANVGLREYSSEWLHKHLFMPQSVVEGSICQPSPFLYEQVEEPTDRP